MNHFKLFEDNKDFGLLKIGYIVVRQSGGTSASSGKSCFFLWTLSYTCLACLNHPVPLGILSTRNVEYVNNYFRLLITGFESCVFTLNWEVRNVSRHDGI